MVFPDYYKKIRDNRQSFIDYYVSQFGENMRTMFEERFDRIKFCFFVTPERIDDYISSSLNMRYAEESIAFLGEIGFDTSKVSFDGKDIHFQDEEDEKRSKIYLPLGSFGSSSDDSSFLDRRTVLKESDIASLLKERWSLLEELGYVPKNINLEDYVRTKEYKELEEYISKVATLALKHKEKAEGSFHELALYGRRLKEKNNSIGKAMERGFILDNFYNLLSDKDNELIENNPNFDCNELSVYPLLLGKDFFMGGLIKSFFKTNSSLLNDPTVSSDIRETIIKDRAEYFRLKNIDLFSLGIDKERLLNEDWYSILELKDYLPDPELVKNIETKLKLYRRNYNVAIASLSVIQGDSIVGYNYSYEPILHRYTQTCSVSIKDGEIEEVKIFFCPFGCNPDCQDVALRHEIRHAMTASARMREDGVEELKVGNNVTLHYNGELVENKFEYYNEAVTETESFEETRIFWDKGIYIINDLGTKLPEDAGGNYGSWLPNFKIVYDVLPPEAKRSQIESTNDSLYRFISEEDLIRVDALITRTGEDDEEVKRELKEIAEKISSSKSSLPIIKSKNIDKK